MTAHRSRSFRSPARSIHQYRDRRNAEGMAKQFEKRTISSGCGKGITFTNYDREKDQKIDTKGPVMTVGAIRDQLTRFRTISTSTWRPAASTARPCRTARTFCSSRRTSADTTRWTIDREGVPEGSADREQDPFHEWTGNLGDRDKAGRNRFPILISRPQRPAWPSVTLRTWALRRRVRPRRPDEHLYVAEPDQDVKDSAERGFRSG